MARKITIGQIGDYMEEKFNKLLSATVLATDGALKDASPVDTGRFRASWQVGQNAAPGKGAPEGNYSTRYEIQRIGYQKETAGNIYSVHNNLPYAERLATGWSKKVSRTWIPTIAKNMQNFVEVNAARIGKES